MTSVSSKRRTCSLCGHDFDADQASCRSCPLPPACQMVCCPACGYTTPDPSRSRLARWLSRLQHGRLGHAARSGGAWEAVAGGRPTQAPTRAVGSTGGPSTLADVPPGAYAVVVSLSPCPAAHLERLQAYGLCPGHRVRVIQHRPVTVVRVDHTELALERDLARGVLVERGGGP